LLIIIGALILFATFAIKDVLRDSAKGLAESINAAENLYLIRDDDLELHEELDEIDADVFKSRMDSLSAPLNSRKSDVRKSARSADFERNSQRLLRIENETGLEVDNLARLVLKAPPTPEHMAEFSELIKQWDLFKINSLKADSAELKLKVFDFTAVNNRNRKDYSDVWVLSQRIHLVGALIVDDAQETKEKKEHLVSVFTPISYGLYVLGVLLTLLSKFFGA